MRKITLAAIALFAAACGPNLEKSCEAYVEAVNACVGGGTTTATGDTTGSATATGTATGTGLSIDDSFCAIYDGYSGSEAKDAAAYLDCLTDALTADCAGDISGCTP